MRSFLCLLMLFGLPAWVSAQEDPAVAAKEATAQDEANALKSLNSARRLVLRQRWDRLNELIETYPNTTAAAEARTLRAELKENYDRAARRKLHEALWAPLIFDQRWRRLKEVQRDFGGTVAAKVAERIFNEHADHIPPIVIANQTESPVSLTGDTPYEVMKEAMLEPGDDRDFPSAFPVMVRVPVRENEWDVYTCLPGLRYVLETSPGNVPVLYCAPIVESLSAIPPQK